MNFEDQRQPIVNSLKVLTDVLKDCQSNYRILGSIIIVAYTQKIFRKIGDVDVLLDKDSEECVINRLRKKGFTFTKKHWANFYWWEASKKDHLGITIFLAGIFHEEYFSHRLTNYLELRIKNSYLTATQYKFNGVNFIGIPLTSAISGIKQAFLNPKRSLDKQVLEKEIKSLKVAPYGNINVYFKGTKLPFLYDIFSFLYNIYGGLRVGMGQKYEIWD
jgi:hypothetical protein